MNIIVLIISILAVFQNSTATADECHYIKYSVESCKSHQYLPRTDSAKDIVECFVDDDLVIYSSSCSAYIVKRNELVILDSKNKTFLRTKIPFDPTAILTEVSLLRYLNTERTECFVSALHESMEVLGRNCQGYTLEETSGQRRQSTVWTTTNMPFDIEKYSALAKNLRGFEFFSFDKSALEQVEKINGVILFEETTYRSGAYVINYKKKAVEISSRGIPDELLNFERDYDEKKSITYKELENRTIGAIKKQTSAEERAVIETIRLFRQGCIERDIDRIEEWAKDLFADDIFVVGTDAPFPDSWEWRGGIEAAKEMFARDWKFWGEIKIFEDELFLDVEGDAAWIVAFATVTIKNSDDDRSRKRAIDRIQDYAREDWPSRRILYEIIADAGQVLAQYERGNDFVSVIRAHFGLVKRNGKWLIKMIHWSHPARGFRSWRLLNVMENR